MHLLPVALAAVLLLPACSGESACDRYARIGSAGDMDDQSASPEDVREATEALAECMAEEADQGGY